MSTLKQIPRFTQFNPQNSKHTTKNPHVRCLLPFPISPYIYTHTHTRNSPIFPHHTQIHSINQEREKKWVGPNPKSCAQIIQTKFHSQESAPLVCERGFPESSVNIPPITTPLFRLRLLRFITAPLPPPDLRRGGGAGT